MMMSLPSPSVRGMALLLTRRRKRGNNNNISLAPFLSADESLRIISPTKQQHRYYSKTLHSGQGRRRDPFRVLGIPRGSSYQTVKETFLRLAMQHHPDRNNNKDIKDDKDNNSNSNGAAEEFIQIRHAFEVIREGKDGKAEATDEPQWTEEALREFMEEQTSHFLSFRMDHDTRQEVIRTVDELSPGGLDRGGTWLMARMLAERENCHDHTMEGQSPPPKLISDRAESSQHDQRRRRRRRRKRE